MNMNTMSSISRQQIASVSGRPLPQQSPCLAPRHRPILRAVMSEMNNDMDEEEPFRMDFLYLSPEQALEMERRSEAVRQEGLGEYEALKELLLRRTWRFGAFFAGYLLLAVSTESAFSELVGAAASYGYFTWLIKDVDAIGPDSEIPLKAAEQVRPGLTQNVAKLFAAYRQALKPRLLVPVGLIAAVAAWNATFPDMKLGIVEQGCLIGGFLSFKIALIGKVYDDLKPKVMTAEELMKEKRPSLVDVGEDVPLEIKRPSEQQQEREKDDSDNDTDDNKAADTTQQ